MDTNYLLMRQQVSLMRAKEASSIEARIAHNGLARGYGARLSQIAFPAIDSPSS